MRISRFCKDGKYVRYIYDDVKTLYDVMRRGAEISCKYTVEYLNNWLV